MPSARSRAGAALAALALVALAVLVAAVASPVDARAPPRPACAVCTDALDRAAAERGVAVERARTSMTVRVRANGSSRWTARVTLAEGADALRNDALREAVVADARHRAVVARPVALVSRVEGDVLVVTYRAPDAAHVTAGVVRFDAFHASDPPLLAVGGEGTAYPGADVIVLRAPDGYRVWGSPGDAANASAVRWDGAGPGDYPGAIDRDAVLSFTREGALLPGVRVWIAGLLG